MKNKCLVLLTSSVFILSSCFNGVKKVSFSEFHEKAVEAQQKERPEAKKIVINGEIESEDKKYTAKNLQITEDTDTATLSMSDLMFILVIGLMAEMPAEMTEVEDNEYYVGNGFRVKNSDAQIAWDEYLSCTLIKGKVEESSCNIKAVYTYEK